MHKVTRKEKTSSKDENNGDEVTLFVLVPAEEDLDDLICLECKNSDL